jgi:F-type H+/Na+-transporting ATPase subunit alpha
MCSIGYDTTAIALFDDFGLVTSIADGIVGVTGIHKVANGEVIQFLVEDRQIAGMILNLEPGKVSAVVLGEDHGIRPGYWVAREFVLMGVPVGEGLLGRVVDPLGNPLDDQGEISN